MGWVLTESGYGRAILVLVTSLAVALAPGLSPAQSAQSGDEVVAAAVKATGWQRDQFATGFAKGISGAATPAAMSAKGSGNPFGSTASNGLGASGTSPAEQAGIRLGHDVANGRTTLNPFSQGFLTGALQDLANRSGAPGPLGEGVNAGTPASGLGEGELADLPKDPLTNRGDLGSPIGSGLETNQTPLDEDTIPGNPDLDPVPPSDGGPAGSGPTGEPGNGDPPLDPSGTNPDSPDPDDPDGDGPGSDDDPDADPDTEDDDSGSGSGSSGDGDGDDDDDDDDDDDTTRPSIGDDDDDDGSLLPLALAGLAGLAAILIAANTDDDDDPTADPAFQQGFQNGIQSPPGQDSWRPQAGPESNPGSYTPGTHGPFVNYEQAEQAAIDAANARRAREACVAGLTQMLDGMNDLAAGLALQAAEAGALAGQAGSVGQAEQLLARAAAKLRCGAARTRLAASYALPGYEAALCDQLESSEPPSELPQVIAHASLPSVWQQFLTSLGPSYKLMREVQRVLNCRALGGACRMKWEYDEEEVIVERVEVEPGLQQLSIAEVCGGNAEALAQQVGRPFGLGPQYVAPLNSCKTSSYGHRSYPRRGVHHGTDMRGPLGTPFQPVAPGTVIYAGPKGNYGNAIVVEHDDGSQSLYGHIMDGGILVQPGERVSPGAAIGRVGSTGFSTGPHLHVEVRERGPDGHLHEIDPEQAFGALPHCG